MHDFVINVLSGAENKETVMYIILNKVDTDTLHRSLIKPELMERVVFLQEHAEQSRLGALLVLRGMAVLVRPGNMNLIPGHPGRPQFENFLDWLDRHNIRNRELRFLVPGAFTRIEFFNYVNDSDFTDEEIPELRWFFSGSESHHFSDKHVWFSLAHMNNKL